MSNKIVWLEAKIQTGSPE